MGLRKKISDLAIWNGTGAIDSDGNPTFKNTTIEYGGPSKAIGYGNEEPLINRISWDLSNEDAEPTFLIGDNHWEQGTGGIPDVGLRGGIVANLDRRAIDFQRFTKFAGSPTGVAFIARQTGLQLMNPKINAPMEGIFGTSPANQRLYNLGINTLSSISAAGVSNIKREGVLLGLLGSGGYEDDEEFRENSNKNRLIYLYNNKISTNEEQRSGDKGTLGKLISDTFNTLGGKGEMLYDYAGGPGSLLGIGRTFIGRYTNTNEEGISNDFSDHLIFDNDLMNFQNTLLKTEKYQGSIKGFPSWRMPSLPGVMDPKNLEVEFDPDALAEFGGGYSPLREIHYGLGNPGRTKEKPFKKTEKSKHGKEGLLNYDVGMAASYYAIDKLNALSVIKQTDGIMPAGLEPLLKDYVPFRFEVLNHESSDSNLIAFRAFIDGISDDYNASHNTFKYNGRGEEFYTYNKFKRSIGLKFKIAAQTRYEMRPLYQKVNYLAAQTAPAYSSQGRIMTPYTQLTVGDWFDQIPGIINSVSLNWQKDYVWEIRHDDEHLDQDMLILPHVLDVSVQFTPVHTFVPSNSILTPYLGVNKWLTQPATTAVEALYSSDIPNDRKPSIQMD